MGKSWRKHSEDNEYEYSDIQKKIEKSKKFRKERKKRNILPEDENQVVTDEEFVIDEY